MSWLAKKRIVIIGGTSGIGLSAAHAFIREGATVLVVGRDKEKTVLATSELGTRAIGFAGDASHENTATEAIALCVDKLGGFDGLYHVAGGSGRKFGDGPLHELTLEGWNKTIDLNLTSLMLSNRAAIKVFKELKTTGTILNMASVLGYSPSPKYFSTHAYAATKAAIIGFTKSIAAYYANENIRINAIAPALVETPMAQRAANDEKIISFIKTKQPLDGGRIGTPADLDGAAVYFMSDYSKFTTGQILSVDGGWSISEGQY
ncbi:MAG: SDR family oxidoreductase [Cyclobacteriaceae bacterium]|jgi:NAD(P)-dependent dehydrogenase (short-subunit alcohol dehydrogenase family)|nr:SDR family oxidoreductase [Cyclobacteriaceae bacterium]